MKLAAFNRDDKSGRIEVEWETPEDEEQSLSLVEQLNRAQIKWFYRGARKIVVVAELS